VIAGRYIVVGGNFPPAAVLLGYGEYLLFNDRVKINREAALVATFGKGVEYAFQTNDLMLSYLMEKAVEDMLPFASELVEMAVKIVRGKPIGVDDTTGGTKVARKPSNPRKPSPTGVARPLSELFAEEEARLIEGTQL